MLLLATLPGLLTAQDCPALDTLAPVFVGGTPREMLYHEQDVEIDGIGRNYTTDAAPLAISEGHVFLYSQTTQLINTYRRGTDGNWVNSGTIPGERGGIAKIVLEGNYAAIGFPYANPPDATEWRPYGKTEIYRYSSTSGWVLQQTILGNEINSDTCFTSFGSLLSMSEGMLIVGSLNKCNSEKILHKFDLTDGTWVWQGASSLPSPSYSHDAAGWGDRVVLHEGQVFGQWGHIFEFQNGRWALTDFIQGIELHDYGTLLIVDFDFEGDRGVVTDLERSYVSSTYVLRRDAQGGWRAVQEIEDGFLDNELFYDVVLHDDYLAITALYGGVYLYALGEEDSYSLVDYISIFDLPGTRLSTMDFYGGTLLISSVRGGLDGYVSFYEVGPGYQLPDRSLSLCPGQISVRFPSPAVTDNCENFFYVPTSGTETYFSSPDTTELTWEVTDASGNRTMARERVRVTEQTFTTPFLASFDDSETYPDCWSVAYAGAEGTWKLSTDPALSFRGNNAMLVSASPEEAQLDYLFSPRLELTAATSYVVTYHYRAVSAATGAALSIDLVEVGADNVLPLAYDLTAPESYTAGEIELTVPNDGQYIVRFTCTNPAGSAGLLLDEISVVEGSEAAAADGPNDLAGQGNGACLSVRLPGLAGTNWRRVRTPDGKLLAEINANGNELGDVIIEMTDYAGTPTAPFTGRAQLGRYFNITPANGSGPYPDQGGVSVRLYLTDAELTELGRAAGQPVSLEDLIVTHYSGENEDCDLLNSIPEGELTTISPQETGDVGGSAAYVAFTTQSFSEFGLTYEGAVGTTPGGVPPLPDLTAFPVPATELLHVQFTGSVRGTAHLHLMNPLGHTVLRLEVPTTPGLNRAELPVADLPTGTYLLSVTDGKRNGTLRVLLH